MLNQFYKNHTNKLQYDPVKQQSGSVCVGHISKKVAKLTVAPYLFDVM